MVQLVGMLASQINTDSHYDSQIDPYISCILIKCVECNTNAKGEHSTQPLGGTYQV